MALLTAELCRYDHHSPLGRTMAKQPNSKIWMFNECKYNDELLSCIKKTPPPHKKTKQKNKQKKTLKCWISVAFCLVHVSLHPMIFHLSRGMSIPTFSHTEFLYVYVLFIVALYLEASSLVLGDLHKQKLLLLHYDFTVFIVTVIRITCFFHRLWRWLYLPAGLQLESLPSPQRSMWWSSSLRHGLLRRN